jgi:hypothetical protein
LSATTNGSVTRARPELADTLLRSTRHSLFACIFKPGSTWEIRATPADGGSRVEVIAVRHLRGFKGRLLAPVFPLGLAKRTVADHLRHFLSKVEEQEPGSR